MVNHGGMIMIIDDTRRAVDTTVPPVAEEDQNPVVMDGVQCNGGEGRLTFCDSALLINQCSTFAGARCSKDFITSSKILRTQYSLSHL